MSSSSVTVPEPAPEEEVSSRPSGPRSPGLRTALRRRLALLSAEPEAGMSTAEYAVGTVAACAFAAVLYRVVTGGSVVTGLTDLVERALATLA